MSRWRKLNQFLAVSGVGKQQTAFGTFLADVDLDTRENCEIEKDFEIQRGEQRNCDQVDLIGQPVRSRFTRFRLTYNNPTPQQIFRMLCYKEGAVASPTGTPANEVQTIARTGTVSGGSFPITFPSFEGRTGTTAQIAWNATNAQILAALTNQASSIGKIIKPGDVVVGGNWTSGITLTFAKRLRNANLPLLTVDNSLITGGGTVGITETTAGDQNYFILMRSADGTKPLFTIATGDKAGSIATEKYGDAVVESVDFILNSEQTNVQMVVVIACNFNAELLTGFTVPACVNEPPVLVVDTKLLIDGVYYNRDLVNHAISLNDNVPVAAAFAFDDIDVSVPFARGDQPTQEFTTELFGDSNSALHALALNEYVEGNEVLFITHFGVPGNRVTITAESAKIKPQTSLDGFSGAANQSTLKIAATPFGISDVPVYFEAFLDQSVAFLGT